MGAGIQSCGDRLILQVVEELAFDADRGVGFLPVRNSKYDAAYYRRYVTYSETTFGVALNSLRVGFVSKYLPATDKLVDIGACDGAFIRARGGPSFGYDINPVSQSMLIRKGYWRDITQMSTIENASFWDSLEHIFNPFEVVNKVRRFCFVSIPVFRDSEHILMSKHFRPDEHYWYFTKAGLINLFWEAGFVCIDMNDMETSLGRVDIGTFVFKRR